MKKFFKLFKRTFPGFVLATFILEIEKHLDGCQTILDVRCGENFPIQYLNEKYKTLGIDGYNASIQLSKK